MRLAVLLGTFMSKEMHLSPRLEAIAALILTGSRVADIGTDHGFLPIYLRSHGIARSVIASDLRKGPLARAVENGEKYAVTSVDYRLAPGLDALSPGETDTIVIAGMGGETIVTTLQNAPWAYSDDITLLLAPQSKPDLLRRYLAGNGYRIDFEKLVRDRGILYPILRVKKGEMSLSEAECLSGVCLVRDPLQGAALRGLIIRELIALDGMKRGGSPAQDELRGLIGELLIKWEEWRHANGI